MRIFFVVYLIFILTPTVRSEGNFKLEERTCPPGTETQQTVIGKTPEDLRLEGTHFQDSSGSCAYHTLAAVLTALIKKSVPPQERGNLSVLDLINKLPNKKKSKSIFQVSTDVEQPFLFFQNTKEKVSLNRSGVCFLDEINERVKMAQQYYSCHKTDHSESAIDTLENYAKDNIRIMGKLTSTEEFFNLSSCMIQIDQVGLPQFNMRTFVAKNPETASTEIQERIINHFTKEPTPLPLALSVCLIKGIPCKEAHAVTAHGITHTQCLLPDGRVEKSFYSIELLNSSDKESGGKSRHYELEELMIGMTPPEYNGHITAIKECGGPDQDPCHLGILNENEANSLALLHYLKAEDETGFLRVLKGGAYDLNEKHEKETLINRAANVGNITILKALVAAGADVNISNESGATPLMFAISQKSISIVEILCERNDLQIDQEDKDGRTPLLLAIQTGALDIARFLLNRDPRPNVNKADLKGITPLSEAARNGHSDLVSLLLGYGADINGSQNGEPPLVTAIRAGHQQVVDLLFLKPPYPDVNKADSMGNTPLSVASSKGDLTLVKSLLEKGAHPDGDAKGNSPLFAAISGRHKGVAKFLLTIDHLDVNKGDLDLSTPLSMAVQRGENELVELLLAKGARIEGHETNFLMHKAVTRENIDLIKILLEKGVKVEANDDGVISGLKTYSASIFQDRSDILDLILAPGVDVNKPFPNGENLLSFTLLHQTCSECLKVLLRKGADTKLKARGHTPLYRAAEHENTEYLKILLEHNAELSEDELNNSDDPKLVKIIEIISKAKQK